MPRVSLAKENRSLTYHVATLLAIPLALVVLVPLLFGIWLVDRESIQRDRQAQEQRREVRRALTIALINQCNRDADQNWRLRRAAEKLGLSETQIKLLPSSPIGGRRSDGTWLGCGRYPPPLP